MLSGVKIKDSVDKNNWISVCLKLAWAPIGSVSTHTIEVQALSLIPKFPLPHE